MKLRPLFILLLFVVSAGILVWIFFTARRPAPAAKQKNPWTETIADLGSCGRRKHVKAVQYDHFARLADSERNAAARLFKAMALSEKLQEHNCADALTRLGGDYAPPQKVVVFRGTTLGNLDRSIAFERQQIAESRGQEIDRAMARQNRYAARVLIWAEAGDLRHVALMERCRHRLAAGSADSVAYYVCPVCGIVLDSEYPASYCPLCLTAAGEFIRFEAVPI